MYVITTVFQRQDVSWLFVRWWSPVAVVPYFVNQVGVKSVKWNGPYQNDTMIHLSEL